MGKTYFKNDLCDCYQDGDLVLLNNPKTVKEDIIKVQVIDDTEIVVQIINPSDHTKYLYNNEDLFIGFSLITPFRNETGFDLNNDAVGMKARRSRYIKNLDTWKLCVKKATQKYHPHSRIPWSFNNRPGYIKQNPLMHQIRNLGSSFSLNINWSPDDYSIAITWFNRAADYYHNPDRTEHFMACKLLLVSRQSGRPYGHGSDMFIIRKNR